MLRQISPFCLLFPFYIDFQLKNWELQRALVTCITILFLLLPKSHANYISRFGNNVLRHCDTIVQGKLIRMIDLARGGKLVQFQVEKVYRGRISILQNIYVLYLSPPVFLRSEKWVLFLRSLSSTQNFRSVGEFSLQEKQSKAKLISLKKFLALELIPDRQRKIAAYMQHCIHSLTNRDAWIRAYIGKEWHYFAKKHPNFLNRDLLHQLELVYPKIEEPFLKQEIQKIIVRIKRQYPALTIKTKHRTHSFSKILEKAKFALTKDGRIQEKIRYLHLLGMFPCRYTQFFLLHCLKDPSSSVRALAVFYLGKIKNQTSRESLLHILKTDSHLRVCKNAIIALMHLKEKKAIPMIQTYLRFPYTHWYANYALKQLVR